MSKITKEQYEFAEKYRSILKEQKQGWNCEQKAWIAQKYFSSFGNNENEIVTKIISEINDIVKLVK